MHTAQAKVKKKISKANFYHILRHLALVISITESLVFEMMTPVVCHVVKFMV